MIELRTLGALNVLVDGRDAPALIGQPKRLALLCYLALAPSPGFRRRDSLVTYFWPELATNAARAALRQALHVIRRTLGQSVIATRGIEELGIQRSVLWCDATAFESEAAAGRLEEAMSHFRGTFLEGFHVAGAPLFEEWLEDTRARLAARARRAAALLAVRASRDGRAEPAMFWARRACELDPDDEACFDMLLRLLVHSGDRCAAMREYERFARRLRRDYGIDPSPEISAMIGSLRSPSAWDGDIDAIPGLGHVTIRKFLPSPKGRA